MSETPSGHDRRRGHRHYYYGRHKRRRMLTFWLGVSIVLAFLVLIAALGVTVHDELREGVAKLTPDSVSSRFPATQFDRPAQGEETLKLISGCTAMFSLVYLIFACSVWIRSR